MSLNHPVLVINASYEPVNISTARHAIKLVMKGSAVVEDESVYSVHTAKIDIPVPSVIRLVRYRRIPRATRAVSRKGILLRDGYRCLYCDGKFPPKDLTLDHVTPQSRGGQNTWENLATSCFPCNNRKGSKTPQEAGMTLTKIPSRLSIHAKHRLLTPGDMAVWNKYLYI